MYLAYEAMKKRLLAIKYETAGQCKKHCCREMRLFLGHAQNGKHRILTKFHAWETKNVSENLKQDLFLQQYVERANKRTS